ncbi:predicted protein [Arabidopsis lyrata subsp. lyrata]|uniref:Predicted protein n=1 Tax=Arabidopsis lyrata subsp. lyrata TaxID=81972 RepID=D7KGY1_ARALL|nr:predicted protein [Arabidopsis lyrata subsp. lyrata]
MILEEHSNPFASWTRRATAAVLSWLGRREWLQFLRLNRQSQAAFTAEVGGIKGLDLSHHPLDPPQLSIHRAGSIRQSSGILVCFAGLEERGFRPLSGRLVVGWFVGGMKLMAETGLFRRNFTVFGCSHKTLGLEPAGFQAPVLYHHSVIAPNILNMAVETLTAPKFKEQDLQFWQLMIAGSVAGSVKHMRCFLFASLINALRSVIQTEGPSALYCGIWSMRHGAMGPAHFIYFSFYEVSKKFLSAGNPNNSVVHAISGAFAAVWSYAVSTPVDMAKLRQQSGFGNYKGVWDCVKRVTCEEGISRFYTFYRTGIRMNVYSSAVHFVTYKAAKRKLVEISPKKKGWWLVHATAGATAGGLVYGTLQGMPPQNAHPCICNSHLLQIRSRDIYTCDGERRRWTSVKGNPSQLSVIQLNRLFQFNLRHNAFPSQTVAEAVASLSSPGDRSFYGRINEDGESEEETETEIRRAFEEDERRRRSPLVAENAVRVMEAMRAISFPGTAPDWASDVNEDRWIDQLRRLRSTSQ